MSKFGFDFDKLLESLKHSEIKISTVVGCKCIYNMLEFLIYLCIISSEMLKF